MNIVWLDTCPRCPGRRPVVLPPDVKAPAARLFAALVLHDLAVHIDALVRTS